MCGFFALLQEQKKPINSNNFHSSADLIKNRGPDGSKFIYTDKFYLKFFRISIIDLSDRGMQPMISKNKTFYLVFNGEIYNANKLKKNEDEVRRLIADTSYI